MKIITAKWLLPITSDPIENGAVVIEKNNIVDFGKLKEIINKYNPGEIEDFGQSLIMPGFVNAHAHLEMSVFKGQCDDLPFTAFVIQLAKKSKSLSDSDWAISSEMGALEALGAGITCIGDSTTTRASIDVLKRSGMRFISFLEVDGMDDSKIPEVLDDLKEICEEHSDLKNDKYHKLGILPNATFSVSSALYKALIEFAVSNKMPLCTHLAESPAEYEFVKYGSSKLATEYFPFMGWDDILWQPMGCSPVKYLQQWGVFDQPIIAVHAIQVDRRDIDILEESNVSIITCPRSNAKLGEGIAPLREFSKRKMEIGLGIGGLASSNSMDMFDEMRIGLLLQRGVEKNISDLNAEKFVYFATMGGAKVLGMDSKIGSIEAGKYADLIVVDLSKSHQIGTRNPYSALVYSANETDVISTMIDGKTIYDRGTYNTLDAEKIIREANVLRKKLS